MIVVITDAAERDLEQIGDYIAQDSPNRAETFIREFRECCEQLAELPSRHALVPRYEKTGVRRRPHGDYLIFYRIVDPTVAVLHILHGAMDYEDILFPG